MIGIDFTWADLNAHFTASLEVFTLDILDSIAKEKQEKNFVILVHPLLKDIIQKRFPMFNVVCADGKWIPFLYKVTRRGGNRFVKKSGAFDFMLRKNKIAHLWIPVLIPTTALNVRCDYVGTCHDLISIDEINNEDNYKEVFLKAKKIVTISSYVKEQIIEKYDIEREKIKMIPNSIYLSANTCPVEEIETLKDKPFILDCNAYVPRKNTLVMIQAFEKIVSKIREDLVLCGGYNDSIYYAECVSYIKEKHLEDRIHVFLGMDEKKKNWLFQNCNLFVAPSENEGFGRTPIEAALFLKPVISSRATSLEEATCGLVHYVENPRDEKELANKILEVLNHPDSIDKLKEIQATFIKKYSPKTIVREYMNLFYELGWIEKE